MELSYVKGDEYLLRGNRVQREQAVLSEFWLTPLSRRMGEFLAVFVLFFSGTVGAAVPWQGVSNSQCQCHGDDRIMHFQLIFESTSPYWSQPAPARLLPAFSTFRLSRSSPHFPLWLTTYSNKATYLTLCSWK